MALAGGGTVGERVMGDTDRSGHEITQRPVLVKDLLGSILFALGIDHTQTRQGPQGQTIGWVDKGATVIRELFS